MTLPLSRVNESQSTKPSGNEAEEYVRFVAVNATPKALGTREIEEASAEDEELKLLRMAIKTGRFEECKNYRPIAGELCTYGQLVLRGTRIVIPEKLRPRVLALAHEGHLGITGTKQNLRTKVWWPGMDRAAEKYCRSCHGCQLVARPDAPEPLRPTRLPDGPWRDVAADLLGPFPSGHSILVVVDYFSRYYEYDVMKSTTSEKIIDSMEDIFCRHGLPFTIKSDNGPQFKSEEFSDYCERNGIEHLRVTAKWAQANGEVERQNSSLLKRIQIAQAQGLDWRRELRKYVAKYRGITHSTTGRSPAELLFNRRIRGKLPDLTGYSREDTEVADRDAEMKGKSKLYADDRRNAKMSNVDLGDVVLVKQDKLNKFSTTFKSDPHTVVKKSGNQVVVEAEDGTQYYRNTSHVKKYFGRPEPTEESRKDPVPEKTTNVGPDEARQDADPVQEVERSPMMLRQRREKRVPEKWKDFILK